MNRHKLIYITGTGHSGSTLLDMIMGSSDEVLSLGELSFYNLYKENITYKESTGKYQCTCGKNFKKCRFWSRVSSSIKIKKFYSIWEEIQIIIGIFIPWIKIKKVTDDTDTLIKELKGHEMFDYVLDSSKDLRRLFILMENPKLDVYPVVIMRRAEAVAHSYSRNGRIQKSKNYYIMLLQWILTHFLIKKIVKNKKYTLIDYEYFCRHPKKYIQEINKKLDICIDEKDYLKRLNSKTYHNIDGNIMRFKKIGSIESDDLWKNKITSSKKIYSKIMLKITKPLWSRT